jgi:hypothetical protein
MLDTVRNVMLEGYIKMVYRVVDNDTNAKNVHIDFNTRNVPSNDVHSSGKSTRVVNKRSLNSPRNMARAM